MPDTTPTRPDGSPTKQDQWQRLLDNILGYEATWLTDIGLKTGLFAAIADAGAGIDEQTLAAQLGYDRRYVALWCRSAYAFELLNWDEQAGYRLPPELEALLLNSSDPLFSGGRIQFYAALYEDFHAFPTYLREGGVWPRSQHDPWLLEALKNGTKRDCIVWAKTVLPQAPEALARLERGGRLLDVGTGAGFALVHYAQQFPAAQLVGLELDEPSIALARQAVDAAGLGGRVEVRHGDANELDEASVYDLVTMNITLHETGGPAEWRNVLARVQRALTPAGTLLVAELPYPDAPQAYRADPVYRMLAGLQLHEALVGCGAITQGELPALLEEAGFAGIRVAEQPVPSRVVMLADKPTAQTAQSAQSV